MVRRTHTFAIVFLFAGFACAKGVARADVPDGELNLVGNVIHVRLFRENDPAADVPLRLFDAVANKVVAVGRSDAKGRWTYPLEKSGKYEVEIVGGPAPDDSYRMIPITWTAPQAPEMLPCCRAAALKAFPPGVPEEFPLETVAVGLGCLGAAGSILFLRRLGTAA